MKISSRYLFIITPLLLTYFVIVYIYPQKEKIDTPVSKVNDSEFYGNRSFYQVVPPFKADITVLQNNIPQVTHIEITPDSNYMLVATLKGTIYTFKKVDGVFKLQDEPFYTLITNQPGFPSNENGLTGIAFGADFKSSADVFLFYSYKNSTNKKSLENRIVRLTFSDSGGIAKGIHPEIIFTGNVTTVSAHQIEKGVGVMIQNKPHVLFTIGDSFEKSYPLNPAIEAGKLMLIQRDGSDPLGTRPYPAHPKIQALGMRNGTSVAVSPTTRDVLLTDTGTERNDRVLFGKFIQESGKNNLPLSFKWDGEEASLLKSVTDSYNYNKESVLYRWSPSETPVNSLFISNKKLPTLLPHQQHILVTTFGESLSVYNKPGKNILLGTLTTQPTPSLKFETLIERTSESKGKLGHPLGLAVDKSTGKIYFGDIIEGRIYEVTLK